MKSETQIRKELELTLEDLKAWEAKFEKATDADRRRLLGQTIIGLEGRRETLEWILREH